MIRRDPPTSDSDSQVLPVPPNPAAPLTRRVTFLGLVEDSHAPRRRSRAVEFDTTRQLPPRGSVRRECDGVLPIAWRLEALREDLDRRLVRDGAMQAEGR